MTRLERARATMRCRDSHVGGHPHCALMDYSDDDRPFDDVDYMACGDTREERHDVVASLLLDGES